jgi:hypothetical protein
VMEEEEEEEGEEEQRGGKGGKGLARATVVKLAKATAGRVVLSGEVQTALVAASNHFVSRITSGARQQGRKRQKGDAHVPMIGERDVEDACKEMGFDFSAQLGEVSAAMETKQKSSKLRRSQQSAVPPEERARLQARHVLCVYCVS